MSQSQYSGSKGFKATAALAEGVLVKLAAGNVVVATAATDKIVGITENSCEASEVVSVRLSSSQGSSKVKAGAAVAVGAYVTSDATGRAITATAAIAGAVPTSRVVGQALEAAVAANDLIEILNVNFVV